MATLAESRFRHEAVFYRDLDEFLQGTLPFIEGALAAGEPVMVAVGREKTAALRAALGDRADAVDFAEMESLGANPGRIISAWTDFAEAHAGRRLRGIGEPAWPGRDAEELVECDQHESLLNLALSRYELWLLCPYDAAGLDAATLEQAQRNHPFLSGFGAESRSVDYDAPQRRENPLHQALSPPPERATEIRFSSKHLGDIRNYVVERAVRAGLEPLRAADIALAVHELATNSVDHGGGAGTLLTWYDAEDFCCEVRDRGQISDPLVGRTRTRQPDRGGRGVWLVHQLCDLVQVRALENGNAVRVRMTLGQGAS